MEIQRKQEYNQEMKASMDYNKALVSAIYNAKREREVSRMKSINKVPTHPLSNFRTPVAVITTTSTSNNRTRFED